MHAAAEKIARREETGDGSASAFEPVPGRGKSRVLIHRNLAATRCLVEVIPGDFARPGAIGKTDFRTGPGLVEAGVASMSFCDSSLAPIASSGLFPPEIDSRNRFIPRRTQSAGRAEGIGFAHPGKRAMDRTFLGANSTAIPTGCRPAPALPHRRSAGKAAAITARCLEPAGYWCGSARRGTVLPMSGSGATASEAVWECTRGRSSGRRACR